VLSLRLRQLRDPQWVRGTLQRGLAALGAQPAAVAGFTIDYCKIKPNRDINVAVTAVCSPGSGAAPAPRRLSLAVYGSGDRAAARFADQAERLDAADLLRRAELRGLARPAALLPDRAIIVRAFPADPGLPGLAPATDERIVGRLLAEHLPRHRAALGERGLRREILHYKPGRSCSIRYELRPPGDGAGAAAWTAYGKVYRDERGAHCYGLLRSAWEAAARNPTWRAARPIAFVAPWRAMFQEAVSGRQFRHVFGDLTHDDAQAAELRAAGRHLDEVASAVRSMQDAAPPPGAPCTFDDLLRSQEGNLRYLRRFEPALADEIAAIRAELRRLEPRLPPGAAVFSHGDLAHGNVLIDEGEPVSVGIIDFDRAAAAEPAYDVAYFLTHLWSFALRHPRRRAHIEPLCARFRQAYLDRAPQVHPGRLALYEALDFAAYVLRNFRKQSHQESWLVWARGQVEAARERLVAAGGGP
jgi:aminoglycoside phosphotransferase (APT) family kinase protein